MLKKIRINNKIDTAITYWKSHLQTRLQNLINEAVSTANLDNLSITGRVALSVFRRSGRVSN